MESTSEAHERLQRVWAETRGQGYDLRGALGVAFGLRHNRRRWFCSEWCARRTGAARRLAMVAERSCRHRVTKQNVIF